MTTTAKRRKRYLSGSSERAYVAGRAPVGASAAEPDPPALVAADEPLRPDDLSWGTWEYMRWLVNDWTLTADERLDAVSADVYDLGDRINQLIIMMCVGMLVLVTGVGTLLLLALT